MNRLAGVIILLILLYGGLAAYPNGWKAANLRDVAMDQGLFGLITLGAALVIVTGGIDLSIGSVVGLGAISFGVLLERGVHPFAALAFVTTMGLGIGLAHGLLIARFQLPPFIVTLCGMFIYRGAARLLSKHPVGIVKAQELHPEMADSLQTLQYLLAGYNAEGLRVFPAQFVVLIALVTLVGLVLHRTAHGRYWYAIGFNDQAARYAGIPVERYRIAVYALSGTLSALAGGVLLLTYGSEMPETAGASYELYAITGAVLGGFSLRGAKGLPWAWCSARPSFP